MNDETEILFSTKKSASVARKNYIAGIADKIQSLIRDEKIPSSNIMVLVQRRNPFAPMLVAELKNRDIDVAGSDRIILPEFPAIRDLLNLIRFCLDQADDYSLTCVLRSPLYALNYDDIYKICHDRKTTVFEQLSVQHPGIYSDLNQILEWSTTLAPYSFFMRVLDDKRAKMIGALGAQIIDPLEEFLTICLSYERTQPGTLKHFIKWFITGGAEIKRDMDSSAGVRIVTVHGSKGLEAPVVFLIDTIRTPRDKPEKVIPITNPAQAQAGQKTCFLWRPQKSNSEKLLAAAESAMNTKVAEYYRLLYVAMTRARDRLYIYGFSTTKNPPEIAWHTKLVEIMPNMPDAQIIDGVIKVSNV